MLETHTKKMPSNPNTHRCYITIKATVYTEDIEDIRHHKVTQNTYKYDLQAPSAQGIRDKNMENTNFVPSSIQGR